MCEVHTKKGSDWSKHVCELTADVLLVKVSPLITTLAETETNSVAMWLCQVVFEQTLQHLEVTHIFPYITQSYFK
jgi:hypothetical protein